MTTTIHVQKHPWRQVLSSKGSCNNKCCRFNDIVKRSDKRDKKYCTTCEYYIITDHMHCQCCKHRYRVRLRNLAKRNRKNSKNKKLSQILKGRIPWNKGLENCFTQETLSKRSESLKGRIPWNKSFKNCFTADTLKKMSESKKGHFGRTHSLDSKIKISQAKKGQIPWNKGQRRVKN